MDVNVLVDAHRTDAPNHDVAFDWLERARRGSEPLGVAGVVASGFVRVVTHPRVFTEPTPTATALEFVASLMESGATMRVEPGDRHLGIFTDLCRTLNLRGNAVPDAYLAALAIEAGATWVTADRGFARFPGLRWTHPSDD